MRFFARRVLPPRRIASRTDGSRPGAPPTQRSWPILSPVFVPTAEPVGDPALVEPALEPCPDLSFFFAGEDLRRSPHSRVSLILHRLSFARSRHCDRSRSSDCCSIEGSSAIVKGTILLSNYNNFGNTSWLWGLRSWCWWSRWWSSRLLDCSVSCSGQNAIKKRLWRFGFARETATRAGDFNARMIRTHVLLHRLRLLFYVINSLQKKRLHDWLLSTCLKNKMLIDA